MLLLKTALILTEVKQFAVTLNLSRLESALQTLLETRHGTSLLPRIHYFDTLVSTNQTAWELLEQGEPAGTVVISGQQTAGRGQWGRQWQSSQGGLFLSKTLDLKLSVAQQAQLTLCSAWGIATILRDRGCPVQLKWPNDLILNQRKLGGILTETKISQHYITQAVIGVGINWSNPVPEIGINLQTFFADSATISSIQSLEFLAALILQGLDLGIQQLSSATINKVLTDYTHLLTCIGKPISIADQQGVIIGISEQGNLRVGLYPQTEIGFSQEIDLKPGTISVGYS
ncbi:biotin--[acetyl-CoA-carboxylase] ligase [Planktothrix pseudagardhii]|uniref:Bifunctional ligase/repressor BirA n=1 Tax=Planktothrix pseudagardhii TaxID=132604 RepID=A0A9W4G511_9CYAN|nr:biotin--[acetyl-CoA-carboxylase] ligase [Planktothrix pseudagardhii]CAD5934195.1 Bifunctional ligase/repressor BirA [Planktothrix pseudagardhii]